MKRILSMLLIISLLLSLGGCGFGGGKRKDHAIFYYRRASYLYGQENGVIASEKRDISDHAGDLSYLLSLYLIGPLDEELESPFPKTTRLTSVRDNGETMQVVLSNIGSALSDSEFSLACACLTLTCLELSNATEVTIISGERTVTMTRESLVLYDGSSTETTNGG